eukprot:6197654-Pleurochrysis_carterae.AAC.2
MISRTAAAMSRRGAPRAVRLRSAAQRSRSKSSLNNASPRAAVSEPSPAQASCANAIRPKAGVSDCTPPPATACETARSSPNADVAAITSAAAPSPRVRPQRPHSLSASMDAARRVRPDGRQPHLRNLTTSGSRSSSLSTASASSRSPPDRGHPLIPHDIRNARAQGC